MKQLATLAFLGCLAVPAAAQTITDVPRRHPSDPHRFTMNGQAWYPAGYYPSIGSLTSDQQDYANYYRNLIDKQAANGINYFRNVFTMGQQYGTSTIPYQRPGPGTAADGRPKFDLTRFNQAHFDYFRNIVDYARTKGVVIQLCILDAWHNKALVVEDNGDAQHEWGMRYDFYYGQNNVNGIDTPTAAEWTSTTHPAFNYHKAMVRKLVDTVGDLPNIVWEVANEQFTGDAIFQRALADEITAHEQSKGFATHLVMPRDLPNHEALGHCIVPAGDVHNRMVSEFGRNQPLFSDND